MKYPYIVYRLAPAFYSNSELNIVKNESLLKESNGFIVVYSGKIYDPSGEITAKCRHAIETAAARQSKRIRIRLCVVYGQDDCVYFKPDGSFESSKQAPSMVLKIDGTDHKAEISGPYGKIDKVNLTKAKQASTFLVLMLVLLLSGCLRSEPRLNSEVSPTVAERQSAEVRMPRKNKKKAGKTSDEKTGPTAQCQDGSTSYSNSRSETCSHHGGVAKWFK